MNFTCGTSKLPAQRVISDMQGMTSALSEKWCRLVEAVVPEHCKAHPTGPYQSSPVGMEVAMALNEVCK